MSTQVMASIYDVDPDWEARSDEDKRAVRAGALSAADRKVQCWGLPSHWRAAGPFDWTGCDDVVVMPGRLSGVPTVGESRFSADRLLQLHELGMSPEEIVEDYELDLGIVRRVLAFAVAKQATAKAA
jgi:uncharacterized protein (DUF433 family)